MSLENLGPDKRLFLDTALTDVAQFDIVLKNDQGEIQARVILTISDEKAVISEVKIPKELVQLGYVNNLVQEAVQRAHQEGAQMVICRSDNPNFQFSCRQHNFQDVGGELVYLLSQ